MDSDDRLRQLIDHPPRDEDPPRDPVLTAQVMARLRPRPVAAPASRRGWWVVAVVAAVAALALPAGDDAVARLAADDLLLLAEVALAALVLALPAFALARSRA